MRIEDLQHKTTTRMAANTVVWTSVVCYVLSWIATSIVMKKVPHWIIFAGLVCLIIALMNVGMFERDTHLPFLGTTYVPPTLFKDHWHSPQADITVTIPVSASAKGVAYWSALPHTSVQDTPQQGYGDYSNAGFSKNAGGHATLRIKCPGRYIARGKTLPKHVHWREVFENGLVGPVQKRDLVC